MILNIFFSNKSQRREFLKEEFKIKDIAIKNNTIILPEIKGIKNIKFKTRFNTIPGCWLEIKFSQDIKGEKQYDYLLEHIDCNSIDENVFYPRKNMPLKDLEIGWINKYNLLSTQYQEEVWQLFFQEIKTHMKYNRIDIVYKGLLLFLKYNPFFLKKYKRYYILEDLAYAYESMGNIGKTIKSLKMQAILQPTSIEPYLNMSSFYIINGMEEEAFQVCQLALEKNPDNPYLISNLIISLVNTGSYEYAIDFLEKVLEKEPDNPYFWKIMGDILYEIENNKGAIACYNKALDMGKEDTIDEFRLDIYTGIADCYYDEDEYIQAVKYYKEALNYNPKDAYLLLSLGQIYFFKLKETKSAYKYTKLLVEDMPENGYGQYQLGLIYSFIGNIERATWHLYKARSIIPYYRPIHDAISMLKKSKGKVYL